jgi:L-ascorbate metabolism protein UlaG (beta-lactamase superfamily)
MALITRTFPLVAAALLALSGTAGGQVVHLPDSALNCRQPCGDAVSVKYLGSGGVLLRHGRDAILTGPLFSNPGPLQVLGIAPMRPDTAVIDARMRAIFRDTGGIAAILVGHSHYDHLMDVPYVARRYVPGVPIYGNSTMLNLLAAWPQRGRLRSVETLAGDSAVEGQWIYPRAEGPNATGTRADSTVRIMALAARHPAHMLLPLPFTDATLPLHYYLRRRDTPLPRLPVNAWEWAEGDSYAFVIDFLREDGTLVFRTHYADTPAWGEHGMPPRSMGRFDLALLCVGGSNTVAEDDSVPLAMLRRIRPRFAMGIHWENFFEPQGDHPHPLPMLDVEPYRRRVIGEIGEHRWFLPWPGLQMEFQTRPRGTELLEAVVSDP